jgi:hypothetical protein
LETAGKDTTAARELLTALQQVQAVHETDVNRLAAELVWQSKSKHARHFVKVGAMRDLRRPCNSVWKDSTMRCERFAYGLPALTMNKGATSCGKSAQRR